MVQISDNKTQTLRVTDKLERRGHFNGKVLKKRILINRLLIVVVILIFAQLFFLFVNPILMSQNK